MKRYSLLPLATVLLIAQPVFAETRLCDYQIGNDIALGADGASLNGHDHVELGRNGSLKVDGVSRPLTQEQQALVTEYVKGLELIVPEVREVAMEAVRMAFDALDITAAALTGEHLDMTRAKARESQRQKLMERLNQSLPSDRLAAGDLDAHLDNPEFSRELGQMVAESTAEMTANVLKSALLSAFDETAADTLEARADAAEKQVDAQMETRGKLLEKRADKLCRELAHLDRLETRLGQFDTFTRDGDDEGDADETDADTI